MALNNNNNDCFNYLNKLLCLDKVQLLKLIQENGFEDVANILKNRDIDGQTFLQLSEIQTLSWHLLPSQKKNLFDFIKKIKVNPFLIIKKDAAVNALKNNTKQRLPLPAKPVLTPKPLPEQKLPIRINNVPSTPEQNASKQILNSVLDRNKILTKSSITKIEEGNIKTNIPSKTAQIPKFYNVKPNFSKPATHLKPNSPKTSESIHSASNPKSSVPGRKDSLGLTTNAVQLDIKETKPRAFLPEPKEKLGSPLINQNTITRKLNKPPTPKEEELTPEEEYEDIDKIHENIDGYLSPNEFDSNDMNSIKAKLWRTKKKTIVSDEDENPDDTYEPPPLVNEQLLVNNELRENQTESVKVLVNEKYVNKSAGSSRPRLPVPTESDEEQLDYEAIPPENFENLIHNIKNVGGYLKVKTTETEITPVQPPPRLTVRTNKATLAELKNVIIIKEEQIKRPANFLESISNFFKTRSTSNYENHVLPSKTESTSNYENHLLQSEIPSIKIPSLLQNRPLPEIPSGPPSITNSSLGKRDLNINRTDLNIDKQLARSTPRVLQPPASDIEDGTASSTSDSTSSLGRKQLHRSNPRVLKPPRSDIEDGTASSASDSTSSLGRKQLHRSNPRVLKPPRSDIEDGNTSSASDTTTSSFGRCDVKGYKMKSPDIDIGKNSPGRNSSQAKLPDSDIETISSNRVSMESQISENISLTNTNEIKGLPEYEKQNTKKTSAASSLRSSISPKPVFADELAEKLSEALKIRERQNNEHTNKMSPNLNEKRNMRLLKTPPTSDAEDDIDLPFYGNIDDLQCTTEDTKYLESPKPSSSFLWRNFNPQVQSEKDDEFDDIDQPVYGNIDESDENIKREDEVVDKNIQEIEGDDNYEQEEYIDSIFNINNERFYRNTDRKGAKQLLRNLEDGAFLFRPSRKYFLVLTLKYHNSFFNLGIERTPTNKIRLNADMNSVSPEFGTLRAFVEYFRNEALTFMGGGELMEILLNPVLPSDLF